MLLFEQVIYEYMKDYARATFSGKELDAMLSAADQWRLPYWDWAAKKPDYKKGNPQVSDYDYNLPVAFLESEIVLGTSKIPAKIPNPLYQFRMPGGGTFGGKGGKFKIADDLKIIDQVTSGGTFSYSECKATSRHPEGDRQTTAWVEGIVNNNKLINTLRDTMLVRVTDEPKLKPRAIIDGLVGITKKTGALNESLRDAYSRLFSIKRFEDFASTQPLKVVQRDPVTKKAIRWLVKEPVFNNCESMHNSMHMWCGGSTKSDWRSADKLQQGQMSDPEVAAFDPLFWFHHCNIDRTIAIWQAIAELSGREEQDKWFDGAHNQFSAQVANRDLRPFHKKDGTYWRSKDSRDIVPLGYTYPELDKDDFIDGRGIYDGKKHLDQIIKQINDPYNSARIAAAKARLTASPGEIGPPLMRLSSLLATVPGPNPDDILNQTVDDYAVNVVYEKSGFQGRPFTISIFVGKVPSAIPYDFHDPESSLVGQIYNFTSPSEGETRCENCAEQAAKRTLATGRVVLTNGLITRWKQAYVHTPDPADGPAVLASMDPHDVVPFLAANLHWRITATEGLVDVANIPSVKVSVVVGKAEHFADVTKLSRYYDYRPAYQITAGKPGGAGPGDYLYPEGSEWQP